MVLRAPYLSIDNHYKITANGTRIKLNNFKPVRPFGCGIQQRRSSWILLAKTTFLLQLQRTQLVQSKEDRLCCCCWLYAGRPVICKMNIFGERMECLQGISEHGEIVKGKLSLGAKILQVEGLEKIFKKLFSVKDGERLLKVSQCDLSTTSGPMTGFLFISTDKVAFCSERSIKATSPTGKLLRISYRVMIPMSKINKAKESENSQMPSQNTFRW